MTDPILPKSYYSIGEVCEITGLRPHVLRYWESQFSLLQPPKNRAGNRVYRPKDIELILLLKRLLHEEKYTLEGAAKRLQELRRSGELPEERREALEPGVLTSLREELLRIRELLTPPAVGVGK